MGREYVRRIASCEREIEEIWVIARRKERLEEVRSKCGEVVAGGQQARASSVHAGAGLSASPDSGKICPVGTDDGTVGADPQTVKEQGFDRFHAL